MSISRRSFLATLAGTTVAWGVAGCATNLATGRSSYTGFYSVDDDIALGRREHPKLVESFGGEYRNAKLQGYVSRVGQSLAKHTEYQQFPYQFTLLNTPIVNAFALPGGYVYVSRGLLALAGNEAEMAGVLSHELGHVNARHTAERLSAAQLAQIGAIAGAIGGAALGVPSLGDLGQSIAVLSIQSYSRKQEFEADTLGVRYMSKSGYDPDGMVTFLATLREQSMLEAQAMGLPAGKVDEFNMMSTHPRTIDRVKQAQAAANVQRPATPRVGRREYLAHIDGMTFGDDPEQGIVFGRRFVHPVLGFEFTAPEGFRLHNEPDMVVAQHRGGAAMVFDMARADSAGNMSTYVQYEWASRVKLNDLKSFRVNGMDSGTGWARVQTDRGVADVRLVAIRAPGNGVYRFMFLSGTNQTSAMTPKFEQTVFSFRRLTENETLQIRPLRLVIVDASGGERVSTLARTLPFGSFNDAWFRVLNDMRPGEEPAKHQPLKVVRS